MLCRGQGGLLLVVAGEAKGRAERADDDVGDCVRPVLVSIQAGNVGGVLQPNRKLLLLGHAGDRARGAGERKTLLLGSNN